MKYIKKITAIFCVFILIIGTVQTAAFGSIKESKKYSLENWECAATSKLNATLSDAKFYDGEKSVFCKRTPESTGTNAYFLVANSNKDADICKVARGSKYLLTFKYFIETAQTTDFNINVIYAKSASRNYNPTVNANKYTVLSTAATGKWLNGAIVLDTSVISNATAVCVYLTLSNFSSAAVYIDSIEISEIDGNENITVVHNYENSATNPYYEGNAGDVMPLEIAGDGEYTYNGVYSDANCKTPCDKIIKSGINDVYLKLSRNIINIDMENYYSDAKMSTFGEHCGMDNDFELAESQEKNGNTVTYNCEEFNYPDGCYSASSVYRSTDVKTSGNYSVRNENGGYFPVGDGTDIATLLENSIYKLTFKYYVAATLTDVKIGVSFADKSGYEINNTENKDTFTYPKGTPCAWYYGEIYLNSAVIEKENANAVYLTVNGVAITYFDDFSLIYCGTNGDINTSGKISMHRKGETFYFENATINNTSALLETGCFYTLKFFVKMDKYAQTNGAIGILRTSSPFNPFSAASGYNASTNVPGNYEDDIIYTTPISDLTDGIWHAVTVTFKATTNYIAISTPAYCSLYFDDFKIFKFSADASETKDVSFTQYIQKVKSKPEYIYSNSAFAVTGFENYPYALPEGISNVFSNSENGGKALKVSAENSGYVRLTSLNNRTLYKITFNYKTDGDGSIDFVTFNEEKQLVTEYKNYGGTAVLQNTNGKWEEKTVYLSTDFAYIVLKNAFANSKDKRTAEYGNILGFNVNCTNFVLLDNFNITAVTNPLNVTDVSVLTDTSEKLEGKQAMRFYCYYLGTDAEKIDINGNCCDVCERGMFIKSASVYANSETDGKFTVKSAYETKTVLKKTDNFNDVWQCANGKIVFSNYITDLKVNDIRETEAVFYVKFNFDGNVFTVLSNSISNSVANYKKTSGYKLNGETENKIAGKSVNGFKIVYPQSRSYLLTTAAENLISAYAKFGNTVTAVTDTASAENNEILLGNTKRVDSDVTNFNLNENGYVVTVKNGKLVINGGSDLAVYTAVQKLAEMLNTYRINGAYTSFSEGEVIVRGSLNPLYDEYKIAFSDEFNASSINTSIWQNCNGETVSWKTQHHSSLGYFNYGSPLDKDKDGFTLVGSDTGNTAKIFSQSGGSMHISTARVKENGDYVFYGGQTSTLKTMNYKYGILEIRAKIADRPGFTSFWVNGDTAGIRNTNPEFGRGMFPEFDLIESKGATNMVTANIHKWWSTGDYTHNTIQYTSTDGAANTSRSAGGSAAKAIANYIGNGCTLHDSYHIYTFVWNEDKIIYALDGTPFCTVDLTQYKGLNAYNLFSFINLANHMGDDWGGTYVQGVTPDLVTTSIDYLRLYQSNLNPKTGINFIGK